MKTIIYQFTVLHYIELFLISLFYINYCYNALLLYYCFTHENMNLSLDLLASYKTYSFCHKIKDCYLQKDKTDIFLENGFSSFCTQNVVRALRLLDGLGRF